MPIFIVITAFPGKRERKTVKKLTSNKVFIPSFQLSALSLEEIL